MVGEPLLPERLKDLLQRCFTFSLYSQDAPASCSQCFVIAQGLGSLENAEAEALGRDIDVRSRGYGDLEEEAIIRTALVQLASRVQKARPKTQRGSATSSAPERETHLCETTRGLWIARQIGIDGNIVARLYPPQEARQDIREALAMERKG